MQPSRCTSTKSTDILVKDQSDAPFVVVSAIICITFGVQLNVQVRRSWVHMYKYIPLTDWEGD